ncbi:MAG TPA: HD domain-containing protein [Candidatus Kaiserbacteria bacterium]|nr:HD domain-containing protein [Candidatus Kaiserbacteria bacterium]
MYYYTPMTYPIPKEIQSVIDTLQKHGHEAYLVGGCVRDLVIGRKPKDWDVTTNAKPDEIQGMFEETFYTNEFGTVGVVLDTEDKNLKIVEVTPYRTESAYSDKRRPDSVSFSESIEEDLARRDFTINAIAYDSSKGQIVDPYKGHDDLKRHVIRAVGIAQDRFEEDGLRLMRALRFVAELNFALDTETAEAIQKKSHVLQHVSKERIRDELVRILQSDQPVVALMLAAKLDILKYIVPDIVQGIDVAQNHAHSFDVFEHLMRTMQHAADKKWTLEMRLAGLFHDVAKPKTRRWSEEKQEWTFYGHDVVGSRVTEHALKELRFSREIVERVVKLVRWHMFFSDPDKITLSAVRRIISNVGEENVWDLLNLRICDRVGTGRPKEQPFRFRKYKAMVEQALRDPISVKMLKINGTILMDEFHVKAGPRIGWILNSLLEEVLDDPKKNSREYLDSRVNELISLSDDDLRKLGEAGKTEREKREGREIKNIMDKYHVQ